MTDIGKLLADKQKQHGDYGNVSRISQSIKEVLKGGPNWEKLSDAHKEALEMMAVKMARIVSGDSGLRDHWEDIGGYAELGSKYGSSPTNVTFDLRRAMGTQSIQLPHVDKAS